MSDSATKTTTTTTTVSAPGKILLAGGYLVLERPNAGLVIAADKRFYTTVESTTAAATTTAIETTAIETTDSSSSRSKDDKAQQPMTISVKSPQFHATWEYNWEPTTTTNNNNNNSWWLIPSSENESTNSFVEKTLRVCLLYLIGSRRQPSPTPSRLEITIYADNDFYSLLPHLDDDDRTISAVQRLGKFLPCPKDKTTGKTIINKTGLGSSAALTTSLVGALVYHFASLFSNVDDDNNNTNNNNNNSTIDMTNKIHNLAQLCHCFAQGKVGSGFDVSSAIHGTHIYRRFPKCLLPDVLQQLERLEELQQQRQRQGTEPQPMSSSSSSSLLLLETLTNVIEKTPWSDDMVTNLTLPSSKHLQIVCADVCGGSESPSMARKVLKWKQEQILLLQRQSSTTTDDKGKIPYWDDLKELNAKIMELMQSLVTSVPEEDYDNLSQLPATQWPENHPLKALHQTFQQIRSNLKALGAACGNLPIEPSEQTKLCDATQAIPGVVAAVVPGAGGYDAIAVLYIPRPSVVQGIETLWKSWTQPTICPLGVQLSTDGISVKQNVS